MKNFRVFQLGEKMDRYMWHVVSSSIHLNLSDWKNAASVAGRLDLVNVNMNAYLSHKKPRDR